MDGYRPARARVPASLKTTPICLAVFAGAALAACGGSSSGIATATGTTPGSTTAATQAGGLVAQIPTAVQTGAPPQSTAPASALAGSSTPGRTPPAVGAPCTSGDSSMYCLAINFVVYVDSNNNPTATTAQAATIMQTTNQLWAQCDIGFQIERYAEVNPAQYGLAYDGDTSENEQETIREDFQAPGNELLMVTTGTWPTAVNAWTNLPGDGIYGSVLESGIVTYSNGIIYAHELGHYLGLVHVANTSDLMNPIIYPYSTTIEASECQTARATVASYWSAMLR